MLTSAAISSSSTWLRSRRIRYVLLCACSPILCLALPFLCAADLCLRFFHRRRRRRREEISDAAENEKLRRCEEGCCGCAAAAESADQVVLLQRYLEDQLLLVRSMYDCGEFDEELENHDDDDDVESRKPLL